MEINLSIFEKIESLLEEKLQHNINVKEEKSFALICNSKVVIQITNDFRVIVSYNKDLSHKIVQLITMLLFKDFMIIPCEDFHFSKENGYMYFNDETRILFDDIDNPLGLQDLN